LPEHRIRGKVWILGDNVDTDQIIPARYLVTAEPEKLAPHFMENTIPGLASSISRGDIIVAGRNFGCGSSREHAVRAIQGCGVSLVIAKSFARIFFRNSINLGLPVIEADISVVEGAEVSVDMEKGTIAHGPETTKFEKYPEFLKKIVDSGSIINYAKEELLRQQSQS